MEKYPLDEAFMARFNHFAFEEVPTEKGLELELDTQYLAILAVLIGCGGVEAYRPLLSKALEDGFSPIAAKEIVYQATAYLGMGRVQPFLHAANQCLIDHGVALPLPDQTTTTLENRREMGTKAQVAIFGAGMEDFWQKSAMNRFLAANCFGDFYTRTGLTLAQRELITFCFLYAQGGCEPQLMSHIQGNINLGNDAAFLRKVVARCIPWIGYPRSLNALACIQKATDPKED